MDDIWFVRAGKESVYADDFIQSKIVAIGWSLLGNIDTNISKPELIKLYQQTYIDHPAGRVQVAVSQIIRFMQEIKIGHTVMTHDREKQMYYIGRITSDCIWQSDAIAELQRTRNVEWEYQVPRNSLSSEAKNTLGAILTLFLVRENIAAEIKSKAILIQQSSTSSSTVLIAPPIVDSDQSELEHQIRTELLEKSELAIEDRIIRLDWEQMQELVAGILRAMGYRTTVSPRGSDRGIDIFASPDGLGLEEPRIFVEVKHRPNTSIGSQDIRSFIGGRSSGDRCLYVSTGGYSREARYEADRSNIPINLLGIVELRKLFVDYYDKLDEEIKSLIPLKRIYVLAD
ncbi:MAG: restriction endonuclease [Oculatellaceae cyanobacterium bins.114]|nr:restriction endonuclease [Oculatellaceae cyanobacterium bins.114]